jgi:hypothetical protein
MSATTLEQEIISLVQRMDDVQRQQVLDYMHALTRPKGEPGWQVMQHAREIGFSTEDLREMENAIEEWCERIDDFPEVHFDE